MTFCTTTTRREFLRGSCALAAAAVCAPGALLAEPAPGGAVPLAAIRFAAFTRAWGSPFRVLLAEGLSLEILLARVEPKLPANALQAAAPDADNEKFSLLFQGPPEPPLPQDTYTFQHPRIGTFAMFIVPVGSADGTHRYYEAVFNRAPVGPAPLAGNGRSPRPPSAQ